MVGTARDVFVTAVADVFISSFNDNGANKQSQIKINFLPTPLRGLIRSSPIFGDGAQRRGYDARGNFKSLCHTLECIGASATGEWRRCVIQARVVN
jgi:hypothetical protein